MVEIITQCFSLESKIIVYVIHAAFRLFQPENAEHYISLNCLLRNCNVSLDI